MTYVAEAGSNHDGDFDQAIDLIEIASDAGADAVKFQCIPPLKREWMPELQALATDEGIDFLATPFDLEAVAYLDKLDVPAIKIAAPEMVYTELVEAAAATCRPLIISTGMASMNEIADMLFDIDGRVTLLQCTTRYPAPVEQANLLAMQTLRDQFDTNVGLSDHTSGIVIPIAAAALGADVIEKHFTISRDLEGPDHAKHALEPIEFVRMVEGIREVEKALGDGRKDGPVEGERVESRGRRLRWGDAGDEVGVGERADQQ